MKIFIVSFLALTFTSAAFAQSSLIQRVANLEKTSIAMQARLEKIEEGIKNPELAASSLCPKAEILLMMDNRSLFATLMAGGGGVCTFDSGNQGSIINVYVSGTKVASQVDQDSAAKVLRYMINLDLCKVCEKS